MASIWTDARNGNWLIKFRVGGKAFCRSCETTQEKEARRIKAIVEEDIGQLRTGRLAVPVEVEDVAFWVMSGGKVLARPKVECREDRAASKVFDEYLEHQHDKAASTLATERLHVRHLKRVLGEDAVFDRLALADMDGYVNARRKEQTHYGTPVGGATIKKELTTFMQVWDWARQRGIADGPCPIKDPHKARKWAVKLPKPEQGEKFMTWAEIERRVRRGGLNGRDAALLWEYLYLDEGQVRELLLHVEKEAAYQFVYPMFVMAACTGARRSEIMRSQIDDFKFDDGIVVIRERKRRKDMAMTTREVPMRPLLREVMRRWFAEYPGGQYTITAPLHMARRADRVALDQLTRDEARHHFKETLKAGKWAVISGIHALRHSFGAICTRAGIPMNVIARWMGHTTDEMMRHYQHLFPQDEQKWMERLPI